MWLDFVTVRSFLFRFFVPCSCVRGFFGNWTGSLLEIPGGWVSVGNSLLGGGSVVGCFRRVRYSRSMFAEDCSFLSVFFAFMKRVVWEVEVFLYISFNFFYFKHAILDWYCYKRKKKNWNVYRRGFFNNLITNQFEAPIIFYFTW